MDVLDENSEQKQATDTKAEDHYMDVNFGHYNFRTRIREPHTDKIGQDHEAKDTALNNIGSEQAHLDDRHNNGARLCPQTSPEAVELGIPKLENRVCQFD